MGGKVSDERLFWENGIQLDHAAYYFAPVELREKWEQAKKKSSIKAITEAMACFRNANPKANISLSEALRPAQEISNERQEIRSKCENIVLEYLKQGRLRAYAFEAPRTLASPAIELPARLWTYQYSFSASKIKFESITYLETRVIGPLQAEKAMKTRFALSGPVRKAGRPSYKADIEQAFNALLSSDLFDLKQSIKSQTATIRKWLTENRKDCGYDDGKPGYDLIRKTLKPLISDQQKKDADKL